MQAPRLAKALQEKVLLKLGDYLDSDCIRCGYYDCWTKSRGDNTVGCPHGFIIRISHRIASFKKVKKEGEVNDIEERECDYSCLVVAAVRPTAMVAILLCLDRSVDSKYSIRVNAANVRLLEKLKQEADRFLQKKVIHNKQLLQVKKGSSNNEYELNKLNALYQRQTQVIAPVRKEKETYMRGKAHFALQLKKQLGK
ncbi:hypothetical protein Tco_0319015 [Tanacetum coccineum]